MKKILFIISILFFLNSVNANNYNNQLNEGIELSYNFKLNEAARVYDQLIKASPDNPLAYYHKSSLFFWKLMSVPDNADFDQFLKYSDLAIDKINVMMKKNDPDNDLLLLAGNTYTLRTIAFARKENYLECIWAAQKANSFLEKLKNSDPDVYDAYLGLGLFKIFLSQVPSSFKWALEVIGFKADLKLGLEYLTLAAEKAEKNEVESKFYYAFILSELLHDYRKSEKVLARLSAKYPGNLLFSYFLAVNSIKLKDLDVAEKQLQKIQRVKNNPLPKLLAFTHFLMGDVHFYSGNYSKAIRFYTDFLAISKENDYKGIAALRLGYSYDLSGNRRKAEEIYALTGSGSRSIDEDRYAERKGKQLTSRIVYYDEALLLYGESLVMRGKTDSAESVFNKVINEGTEPEMIAEAEYQLALLYLSSNELRKVKELAESILSKKNLSEVWLYPYSLYLLSEIAVRERDQESFAEYKNRVENYSNFDFPSRLEGLFFSLEYRLNNSVEI
ncbi:MAG: hypothetical protein FMNOHCHN_02963 [Ignavibacteriaceae bacterium]|nr:hypothetical protein [Ignavibacteriaceae bacterium]